MDGPLDVHFDPEPSTFGILNPPLSPRPNIIHQFGYFSENVPSNDWELLVLNSEILFVNSLWYRQNQVQLSLVSVLVSGQVLDSLLLN